MLSGKASVPGADAKSAGHRPSVSAKTSSTDVDRTMNSVERARDISNTFISLSQACGTPLSSLGFTWSLADVCFILEVVTGARLGRTSHHAQPAARQSALWLPGVVTWYTVSRWLLRHTRGL